MQIVFLCASQATVNDRGVLNAGDDLGKVHLEALSLLNSAGFRVNTPAEIVLSPELGYNGYTSPQENKIYLNSRLSLSEIKINLVHEYVHRYRFERNVRDDMWFGEGLAQLMEYNFSNWPNSYNALFANNQYVLISNNPADFQPNGYGYPSAFLLFYYVYNNFGRDILLKKMMNSPFTGWRNILSSIQEMQRDGHLNQPGFDISQDNILKYFAGALVFNNFLAQQNGLFFLNYNYEAPSFSEDHVTLKSNRKVIEKLKESDSYIFYSRKMINPAKINAQRAYVVMSINPVTLEEYRDGVKGLAYIYIR